MAKHKHFHIILIGFLFLKGSNTNTLKNENKCTTSSHERYNQFPPYVVIIKTNSNEEILCHGTLIDVNWVLTSAQCMNNNNISLENINLTMGNKTQKSIRKAKKMRVDKNSNLAIIEMDRPIIVTDIVTPIKLATEDLSQKMKCVVSGFQEYSNDDLSLIYWTNVDISKQMYDKNEWYLEDTICHKQLWSLRNITDKGIILVCDQYLYGINFVNKPRAFYNILKHKNWIRNMIDQSITNEMIIYTNLPFTGNNYLLSYINKSENAIETESKGTTMHIEESLEPDDPTLDGVKEKITSDAPSSTHEEETESDDPTSPDVEEITSEIPSSTYEEETESDDPTSPNEEDSLNETTTSSSDEVNTKISMFSTTTTQPNPVKSSSQVISFYINYVTVLCCIIFCLSL